MKILQVKDSVVSIASKIQNAYIDFSKMTVSIVALVTDVIKEGKPVVGYGFHSNGRYAQAGLLKDSAQGPPGNKFSFMLPAATTIRERISMLLCRK